MRILIGGTGVGTGETYKSVLEALQSITNTVTGTGIALNKVVTNGTYSSAWTIEVGAFRKRSGTLKHSHAKLLVVDGRMVIAGGYNVHNYYTGIPNDNMKNDMGLQVRGAVGFEAQTVFDSLWYGAKLYPSKVRVPSNPFTWWTPDPTNPYVIAHAPQIWSHTLFTDTAVFSLYRDEDDKSAERAIIAALNATQHNVNLLQVTFSRDLFVMWPLPYEAPLLNAIRERGVQVRLLTGEGGGWHKALEANRHTIQAIWKALGSHANLFQVRLYPSNHRLHTKALSLDGQFLIVGSQNWNNSATDGGAYYSYNLFDNCVRAHNSVCPAQWYAATAPFTPTAAHNLLNVAPRFVDAAGGDYTLSPDSPALDAGAPDSTTVYDVDSDGDGWMRADMGTWGCTQWPTATGHVVLQSPAAGAMTGTRQIALHWQWHALLNGTPPITPSVYHVQVATAGQFQAPLIDIHVALTDTYHLPLLADGTYYWRVSYTPTATFTETWSAIRQFHTYQHQVYLPLVLRLTAK